MTKVIKIPTSKITQFESKQTPTIQQEKNIIKKDNIGTVVPGDALRNINLSTVPSVIQDAINAMGLSVETNILANALLLQIQRDIDNLGDAIVEKSYIDGQVSYLTSLLGQKSDTGDVASIVDSRIAIVTEDFATTAQVNNLNSRVGESESSITTLNQTINTKDAARATQIEEVEARVNQSLSNYTAVLNLTVDENGNVISQKIESLVAQNARANISIDENNKITLDENGNFTAYVAKFINDGHGNIVGFSFTDSDDAQSVFGINADVFQVSDATNRYTPFRIEDNNIYFNGKVTFSSIFSTDAEWQQQVQSAIDNNATTIDGNKIITGTIGANQINANAISGKIISGGTITGTSIYGSYIEGAIIKASFIDLTSTQTLTNWQQYTPSNYPSAYANNFAHNNDGTLLVDSLGYVRLMGNTKLRSTVLNSNRSKDYGSYSYGSWTMDFYSYNNYEVNSINRPIISSPKISLVGIDTNATTTIIDVIAGTVYRNNISISGNIQIFNYSFDFSANVSVGSSTGTASGTITLNGISKTVSGYSGASISNTVSAKGMPITVTLSSVGTTANAEFRVTINDNEFTLSNLTDTDYIKINSLYCYSSGVYGGNPSNGEITMNINIPSFEVI